ncbi:MAG: HAMP domain-containing sensor histidine kinase [Litorimonas sp.]
MFGSLRKLYRNTLFRLSLLGALLFVLSLFVALGYIYYATIESELRRVDRANEAEIAELQTFYDRAGGAAVEQARQAGLIGPLEPLTSLTSRRIYHQNGTETVNNLVIARGLPYGDQPYERVYVLRSGGRITGNLAPIPVETTGDGASLLPAEGASTQFTRVEMIYSLPQLDEANPVDRRARAIAGNIFLNDEPSLTILVGRDVENIERTGERVRTAILVSAGIALFLGLMSSFFVSRRFARRVEGFNRLATDVRAGNLDRRAPRNYSEDEMDLLAEHLNAMLDHISRLMSAMRYAGDSVAHDLRTPLTRLRTRLETAAVELGDTDEAMVLYAAAGDADQLLSTFDSVLRIARLEAGERRELLKPLDPKPILDDLAELYEPACEDAGLSFEADIAPKTLILADRGLLSQAVSNLLENAIKYTPRGGAIRLTSRKKRGGGIEVAIRDDGPGIPSWDRERVKERFVRLDKSRSLPGSGLGLSLVEAVADLHRAEFVMSDNEDLPAVDKGGDPDRPGLSAALIFPRAKADPKS